jgi:hypothetical protein
LPHIVSLPVAGINPASAETTTVAAAYFAAGLISQNAVSSKPLARRTLRVGKAEAYILVQTSCFAERIRWGIPAFKWQ